MAGSRGSWPGPGNHRGPGSRSRGRRHRGCGPCPAGEPESRAGRPENPGGRQSPLLCSWRHERHGYAPWQVCSCPRHRWPGPPRQGRDRRTTGRRTGPKSASYAYVPSIRAMLGKRRCTGKQALGNFRHGTDRRYRIFCQYRARSGRMQADSGPVHAAGTGRMEMKKGRRCSGLGARSMEK